MASLATDALPVLALFAPAFSASVFPRAQLLAVAAILCTGRRTVCNLLRIVGHLAQGAPSSYHRVLSGAQWSGLCLAALLARCLVGHFWPAGPIRLVGDDTVSEHRGKQVHGKARHRDPVPSSHSYTAFRYGHKWVALCLLVRFPFATRPWALLVLVALYRSPQDNKARGRPHQTPAQLMQLLLPILLRWFPQRQFLFAGDAGFGSHEMAHFAQRTTGRLTLVSKFHPNANLYEATPLDHGKGRPPQKGAKTPSPHEVVARSERTRLQVAWYGGGRRNVEVVSGVGHWYKAGVGLVVVRWVYVHDVTGTHRDDYLYSTDGTWTPQAIIEAYTERWNIETTFEELRAYLGLETTRGWCVQTVLRAEPCLFGLYSVVALWYWQLPQEAQAQRGIDWDGKQGVTFSDAITAVRRWLWTNWVFPRAGHDTALAELPEPLRQILLYALAHAA
jgi:hypothetical protein